MGGLIAAKEYSVSSPISHLTKEEVRKVSKSLGLPNWQTAASPCLRSRLDMGVQATEKHLKRVEAAEDYVRKKLQLDETINMRVRLLAKNRGRIEIDEQVFTHLTRPSSDLAPLLQNYSSPSPVSSWETEYQELCQQVQELFQFSSVTIKAFKSGSVSLNASNPSTPQHRLNH